MSDHDVIEKFVGNFVSNGEWHSTDPRKDSWYPPKGLKLKLFEVETKGSTAGVAARVRLEVPQGQSFEAKRSIEGALYKVDGETLVTTFQVKPDLSLKETLKMVENPTTKRMDMRHILMFSDNATGEWTCPG